MLLQAFITQIQIHHIEYKYTDRYKYTVQKYNETPVEAGYPIKRESLV